MSPFVAVTATEWTSLCNSGQLRIAKDRVQRARPGGPSEGFAAVFAAAPVTHLSDDKDLLILELTSDWATKAVPHPDLSKKVVYLPLASVEHHQALTTPAYDYHQPLGQRVGVEISQETLEGPWLSWVEAELGRSRLQATKELLGHFGLNPDLSEPRPDGLTWEQVISLVVRPRPTGIEPVPNLETLMLNLRRIADNIAETRGLARYHLAALIEWVEFRTGIDALSNEQVETGFVAARAELGELTWDDPALDDLLVSFQKLISDEFSVAFSAELSPHLVGWLIRLVSDVKADLLDPKTFGGYISRRAGNSGEDSAVLIISLVASAMGSNNTRALIRYLEDQEDIS